MSEEAGEDPMSRLLTARGISLLVVLIHFVFGFVASLDPRGGTAGPLLILAGYFLLPLACIWYGDEMGEYIGTLPGPAINRTTPGWMVKIGGWFLLFLPAILTFIAVQNS